MTLIRFYFFLIGITCLQLGIIALIPNLVPLADTQKAILFLAIVTACIYPIAKIGKGATDPQYFLVTTYIAIGIRFVLSLFFILYYKLTRSVYENGFIISFFLSYVFYTIFEITSLTTKLRPNLKEKQSSNESTNI